MKAIDIFTGKAVESASPFFTQYLRPDADFSEYPDPDSITETAYVPPQVQIMDMLDAGVRLQAARKARFDSIELGVRDDEEMPLDPTRAPGVDLVDIQREAQKVSASLERQKADVEAKLAVERKERVAKARQAKIDARAEELLQERSKGA